MKSNRVVISMTILNAAILVSLVAGQIPSRAGTQEPLPVLRGRALEIVDDEGRVRASIRVHGPETVKGKQYPGAVVLQMGDPRNAPGLKLAASTNGAGLGLSSGDRLPDGRSAGIQLHADDPVVLVIDNKGHELLFGRSGC
jgi:hypothetical protein